MKKVTPKIKANEIKEEELLKENKSDNDSKRYNDKTLRLGVITLDLESALLCRVNRIKEAKNELCYI